MPTMYNDKDSDARRFEGGGIAPTAELRYVFIRIVFSSFAPLIPVRSETEGAARGDFIRGVSRGDPMIH